MRSSPVYVVLSKTPLLFGGEFRLTVANLLFGAVAFFVLGIVFWPVVTAIIHIVLVQLAKHDASIRQIYLEYARQGDRYEPWYYPDTRWNDRPRQIMDHLI